MKPNCLFLFLFRSKWFINLDRKPRKLTFLASTNFFLGFLPIISSGWVDSTAWKSSKYSNKSLSEREMRSYNFQVSCRALMFSINELVIFEKTFDQIGFRSVVTLWMVSLYAMKVLVEHEFLNTILLLTTQYHYSSRLTI